MNPEIKQKWITALRSGNYRQGRTKLRSMVEGETSYCCLGVLADIAVAEGVLAYTEFPGSNGRTITVYHPVGAPAEHGDDGYILVKEAEEWCGIDYPTQQHLAYMNDSEYTFDDIAAYIEERL